MTVSGEVKSLFGGAMEIVAPHSFLDASQIREVPDNQEVFVDMTSNDSLIVELLESVKDVDASEAATFHFNNLAEENESSQNSIFKVDNVDLQTFFTKPIAEAESASLLIGEQVISKLKAPYSTDILIAYNRPETSEAQKPTTQDVLTADFTAMFRSFSVQNFEIFR